VSPRTTTDTTEIAKVSQTTEGSSTRRRGRGHRHGASRDDQLVGVVRTRLRGKRPGSRQVGRAGRRWSEASKLNDPRSAIFQPALSALPVRLDDATGARTRPEARTAEAQLQLCRWGACRPRRGSSITSRCGTARPNPLLRAMCRHRALDVHQTTGTTIKPTCCAGRSSNSIARRVRLDHDDVVTRVRAPHVAQ